MDVLQVLAELQAFDWRDEDGEPEEAIFLQGMSEAEVLRYEAELGAPLPLDYRRLLLACRGIDGLYPELDFAPKERGLWTQGIFPHAVPFGHDGAGNYWFVDCLSHPEETSTLFFDCHDPPFLFYQGSGIGEFLIDVKLGKEDKTTLDEDETFDVRRDDPDGLAQSEALSSPDPYLRAFAEELDGRFTLFDLRDAPPGDGFYWGRRGMNPTLRRFRETRIFAFAPEEKKGLFRRLFGSN